MHAWTWARTGTFWDAHAQTNFGMRTRRRIFAFARADKFGMRTRRLKIFPQNIPKF
jgi:hypothetical protein